MEGSFTTASTFIFDLGFTIVKIVSLFLSRASLEGGTKGKDLPGKPPDHPQAECIFITLSEWDTVVRDQVIRSATLTTRHLPFRLH